MTQRRTKLFAWLRKNEAHLSTVVFVVGGTGDIFALTKVPISYGVIIFVCYAVVAIVASVVEHYLYIHEETEGPFLRGLRLALAFLAEFMIGCLLSGLFVFYTRSATLSASWPFVLMLVVVMFGNEFMREYKERLAFRSTLLFFALYAYTIFTLPTLLHHIGPDSFLESSAVATGVFLLFLLMLAAASWKRLKVSLIEITIGVCTVLILVNGSYFTGIIPPLPLSLVDVGVYHSVVRTDQGYEVQAEASTHSWWDIDYIQPVTVHLVPDESLSVFSSVFAPTAFSTAEIHKWEWYNSATHSWQTRAEIAFSISGGRDGGYRGYSTLGGLVPGNYRVSIETISGQIIGRIYFTVLNAQIEPPLHTEIH